MCFIDSIKPQPVVQLGKRGDDNSPEFDYAQKYKREYSRSDWKVTLSAI